MENRRQSVALEHMRALSGAGALGGQSDVRLLEQFSRGHREAAEAAFTTLVERHGPMVLRVCRGVLGDSHDIHDAFQATFLILVRKAGSLWVRDSLGPWLHGVAVRVANKAKVAAARRKAHERKGGEIAVEMKAASAPRTILGPRSTMKLNDCLANTVLRSCSATSKARRTREQPPPWDGRSARFEAVWPAGVTSYARGSSGAESRHRRSQPPRCSRPARRPRRRFLRHSCTP